MVYGLAVGVIREDVGLGTAYERVAIGRLLARWTEASAPSTVLEGPGDGMAGIAGLHALPLARRGSDVTVACDGERADVVRAVYAARGLSDRLSLAGDATGTFDLVISFCALGRSDWRAYLAGRLERARAAVVVVPNRDGWGARLRRLAPGDGPWTDESGRPEVLETELSRAGRIADRAFVDAPWWPDVFLETGDTLPRALARRIGLGGPARRFVYDAAHFPHDGAPLPADLVRALRRHPSFDDARGPWPRVFAHHRAYLVVP